MNSRNISSKTIKSLYAHSGNICAFPGCNQVLAYSEGIVLSNICHIYGLNPCSARYDETKDAELLNSEKNLVLLCLSIIFEIYINQLIRQGNYEHPSFMWKK